MKKKTIIALIVAAVLIVSGSLLIFAGLKSVNFGLSNETVVKTYVVNEPFQSIAIDSDTGDINVPQSRDGGECRIETNTGDILFR